MRIRGGIRERCGREEIISSSIGIFILMILLLTFPTPSVCKLTPPPPPKVTEMTLSTVNSTTVNSNANITVIATVKKWEGNLTKPEGFVIEFEIEEVKGEEIGYYLKKVLRKQMRMGKHTQI